MADYVKLDEEKFIPKSDILSLLRTYNCYHEGKSFQLRHREEEQALVIEGLLNIYWGLRRPIRLQMHDDNERLHYGGVNRNERSQVLPKQTESNNNILDRTTDPALTSSLEEDDEEVPQLLRTRSDASFMGVTRRSKTHAHSDLQHLRSHRFSINGHFYNHKVTHAYVRTHTHIQCLAKVFGPLKLILCSATFCCDYSCKSLGVCLSVLHIERLIFFPIPPCKTTRAQ
ncbi:unnamed protein product [Oncorhynchus mykiss]|uniref:Ras-associating domain-containing protein n=1 Tax=Oncorhynchus mykiss TaxID=8022 RepID=A0A060XW65_ONCMY|nr:unnamed protein product [Oncorhynchus mykiss]